MYTSCNTHAAGSIHLTAPRSVPRHTHMYTPLHSWRDTILSSVANSRPRGRKSKAGSSAKRLRSLYAKACVLGACCVTAMPLSLQFCYRRSGGLMNTALHTQIRSEEDLLALFLIRERALGKSSAWAPYIEVRNARCRTHWWLCLQVTCVANATAVACQVLPKELPLPVFYSRAELEALQVRHTQTHKHTH